MKLLLDTCSFLWFAADAPELSPAARTAVLDTANDVFLSAVSCWEIARKYAQGGLRLPAHPSSLIPSVRERSGIAALPLTESDAFASEKLPFHHRDPFDRMLIGQAIVQGLTLISPDKLFDMYPVRVYW